MITTRNNYNILSDLFRYPNHQQNKVYTDFLELVNDQFPLESDEYKRLVKKHIKLSLKAQQEYYLKTFDVQAVCYLDIGYVLFGEDYKRAQLLVNLQAEHQKAGVDCGTELADHLPNVLKLIAITNDREFANELGFVVLIPAIRFMILKFGETNNFYKTLLATLLDVLKQDFNGEGLEDCMIPERAFDANNDCLITSPKSVVCETMCHQNKKY